MKRSYMPGAALLTVLLTGMLLTALFYEASSQILPGTENVCHGTVIDCTMDPVAQARWEWRNDRRYLRDRRSFIVTDAGSFWAAKGCEEALDFAVGDHVEIQYGIEQGTDLLVATKITVLKK